ncbi:MAG: hypothetical protein ABSG65_10910 [Bryobacteraceae bacterium]|jgi:hypothetical protein
MGTGELPTIVPDGGPCDIDRAVAAAPRQFRAQELARHGPSKNPVIDAVRDYAGWVRKIYGETIHLRSYVLKYLEANQGAEIVASIDASLRQALPCNLLDEARRRMSALLLAAQSRLNIILGIWSDASRLWNGPAAWRLKSRSRLEDYLREHRLVRMISARAAHTRR